MQISIPSKALSKRAFRQKYTFGTESVGQAIKPQEQRRELAKSKEKALRFNAKGDVLSMCVATTRRLSDETWSVFEALFE